MTEGELLEWLGLKLGDMTVKKVRLRRVVVDGMKDVPFPAPKADKAQLLAFEKFLACCGTREDGIVEPIPKEER